LSVERSKYSKTGLAVVNKDLYRVSDNLGAALFYPLTTFGQLSGCPTYNPSSFFELLRLEYSSIMGKHNTNLVPELEPKISQGREGKLI